MVLLVDSVGRLNVGLHFAFCVNTKSASHPLSAACREDPSAWCEALFVGEALRESEGVRKTWRRDLFVSRQVGRKVDES